MRVCVSSSLTNLLRSLACNDALAELFDCECTASTITALPADVVTAAPPLVRVVLRLCRSVHQRPLPVLLWWTIREPSPVQVYWLTLRMPGCGEGKAPNPLAGTVSDGPPKRRVVSPH